MSIKLFFLFCVIGSSYSFDCSDEKAYAERIRFVMDKCEIISARGVPATQNTTQLCSDECSTQAKDILNTCQAAGIGGEGAQVVVDFISQSCDPSWQFNCTSKAAYDREIAFVRHECEIIGYIDGIASTNRSKLCSDTCTNRATRLLSQCTAASIGGNGKQTMVTLNTEKCAQTPSTPIDSFQCVDKNAYYQKLVSVMEKCGIHPDYGFPAWDKDKLCLDECTTEAEELLSKCKEAAIGVEKGAQTVFDFISQGCDDKWEFKCTDADAFYPQLALVHQNCGIIAFQDEVETTSRSKLCSDTCRTQADDLLAKCKANNTASDTTVYITTASNTTAFITNECNTADKPSSARASFVSFWMVAGLCLFSYLWVQG